MEKGKLQEIYLHLAMMVDQFAILPMKSQIKVLLLCYILLFG